MVYNNSLKINLMDTIKVVRVIDHSRVLKLDRAVKSAGKVE
jgi:hypothetical protein